MTIPSYSSYAVYLADLYPKWPEYGNILKLFVTEDTPQGNHLSFVYITEDGLDYLTFVDQQKGWQEALTSQPKSVKAKVVVLSYANIKTMNWKWLDAIGLLLDLDPLFIHNHFARDVSGMEEKRIVPLLSKWSSWDFGLWKGQHTSATFLHDNSHSPRDAVPIILILCCRGSHDLHRTTCNERPSLRSQSGPERTVDNIPYVDLRYLATLLRYSDGEIIRAAQEPMILLLSFWRLLAQDRALAFFLDSQGLKGEILRRSQKLKDFQWSTSIYDLGMKDRRDALDASIRSVQALTSHRKRLHPTAPQLEELQTLLLDLEDQSALLARDKQTFDEYHAKFLSERAAEDSDATRQQGDSMGRLTNLAFLFVPLSLVVSVFGMNVREFGDAGVELWVVVVTAATSLVSILIFLIVYSFYASELAEIQRRLSGFLRLKRFFWKLALVAPLRAMWLPLFAVTHTTDHYELFITYCGIVFEKGDTLPQLMTEPTPLHGRISKLWMSRGLKICEITSRPNWSQQTIWRRNVPEKRRRAD